MASQFSAMARQWATVMLVVGSLTAQAVVLPLEGRDINGNPIAANDPAAVYEYDPNLNITWLRDWFVTEGGDWYTAVAWAEGLTYFGGGWRLPTTTQPDPSCSNQYGGQGMGSNCTGSEMGYLWYTELGNAAGSLTNPGPFKNMLSAYYWSTEFTADTSGKGAWSFQVGSGTQLPYMKELWNLAVAVRDGDVAVPVDTTPPVITPTIIGTLGLNGWYTSGVTVNWNVLDSESPITTQTGCDSTILNSDTAGTTLTCSATSGGGTNSNAVTIKIDTTRPAITCGVTPSVLWPPNHKLVNVAVKVNVADAMSGPDGFTLTSVTSNEPDTGLDKSDVPNDFLGWTVGTPDLNGQLRAERWEKGGGRIYTLSYRAMDAAGNIARCNAMVSVPHDQRK